jgi:hypothetical protein
VATPGPGVEVTVNVVYLAPWGFRRTDGSPANLVAHEVAHHILGHPAMFEGHNSHTEKAADDLAAQWGFKRSYPRGSYPR